MTTIYVVTSGDYDYYHIDGIFSTKEKAEEYIKAPNLLSYQYDIEEFELDALQPYLKVEDITSYWACVVDLSSDYFGKKEGEYYVLKKDIAKDDLVKLIPYKKDNAYFTVISEVSEEEVIKQAYTYYQIWLVENNKYDAGFWERVEF